MAVEQIMALRYKLRMFGIPLEGPARVFCNNEAVYRSASYPSTTLKRRHQLIAYHLVRESVASKIILVYKEEGDTNLADILTKSTLDKEKRMYVREAIMYCAKVDHTHDDS